MSLPGMFDAAQPLLPDYIALNAKWHGEKPAFICEQETLTWAQFGAATNQVANGLAAAGLKLGDTVGVVMDNSLATAEIMFGVMAVAAVVVPINVSVSDATMTSMLEDAGVRAVFASAAHRPRLDAFVGAAGLRVAIVTGRATGDWQAYDHWRSMQSSESPNIPLDPNGPCNIIYSSGTTGTPKGIVHTHQRRLDWAYDLALALRYDSAAVGLIAIGMYSNIVWAGLLPTLICGGTSVIMPRFDARSALELMARHRVTNTAMVPLQYRLLLEADPRRLIPVRSVRGLMSAGSPLWENVKRELIERFGPTIIELYGLTEGLITTLAPEEAGRKLASVGKPLLGTDIRIVDDVGREVPTGGVGEIIGRGRIVMSGYFHRPEATRDVLFVDAQGRQWLKTGDLGKLDDEGFLYIMGRKKDMILSGGQNIYPADIEAVVNSHPQLADVAVIGVPHEKWDETPLALVVLKDGAVATADAIKDWINARVGKQQRVSAVEIRRQLPRNANGKLLKSELRAPYWAKGR
jgi:acyl-CoA synthetase (AMP-forming)/AMP-acid ligase II